MCEWGTTTPVTVKIPADLAAEGHVKWKVAMIDSCIAAIVGALQDAGIDMRGSCCGHGAEGHIDLQDGRGLLVLSPEANLAYLAARRRAVDEMDRSEGYTKTPCTCGGHTWHTESCVVFTPPAPPRLSGRDVLGLIVAVAAIATVLVVVL